MALSYIVTFLIKFILKWFEKIMDNIVRREGGGGLRSDNDILFDD